MRANIYRQQLENETTAFIFNERPRIVFSQVSGQIGDPKPFNKVFIENLYEGVDFDKVT